MLSRRGVPDSIGEVPCAPLRRGLGSETTVQRSHDTPHSTIRSLPLYTVNFPALTKPMRVILRD